MYKLYIKDSNGSYGNPKIFDTYQKARDCAKGEYIIIKRDEKGDEVIEHGNMEEWER